MGNKRNKKSLRIIITVVIFVVFILFVLISLSKKSQPLTQQYSNQPQIQNANFKTHTSQDLKISFKYPKDWHIDDRYRKVLITNYETNLNRDDKPNRNQIEIVLNEFSNCFKTLDEDMIKPACGEGGPTSKNTIISKKSREIREGTFYKYVVKQSNGENITLYFLQNGNKILQLSKQPNPSQFEKEFDDIVNSITFL